MRQPRSSSRQLALPHAPLLLALALVPACVEVREDAQENPIPPVFLEIGESFLFEPEQPLEVGETIAWALSDPAAGFLEPMGEDVLFTAGGTTYDLGAGLMLQAEITGGAVERTESKQLVLDEPEFTTERPFQFAGATDYVVTGADVDARGAVTLVGHSADRVVGPVGMEEVIGKFATVARYAGEELAALELTPRTQVMAVALDLSGTLGAGAVPDAYVLDRPYVDGMDDPARLRRLGSSLDEVWSVEESGFTFAPALASTPDALFVAVETAGGLEVRRFDLDGSDTNVDSGPLGVDALTSLAAGGDRVYALVRTAAGDDDILAFDTDLQALGADEFDVQGLPADELRSLAGPDSKGRIVACGGSSWHLVNPRGVFVLSSLSTGSGLGGDGFVAAAADGDRLRFYEQAYGTAEGQDFVGELLEVQAQPQDRPVVIRPSGTILQAGRSQDFQVYVGGVLDDGFELANANFPGRVVNDGGGSYRVTVAGQLGTYPLALEKNGAQRVTAYVSVTAFAFGFTAPAPGPGNFEHLIRMAMAAGDEYFVYTYANPNRGENFAHRVSFDDFWCVPVDDATCSVVPGEVLDDAFSIFDEVLANVAAAPNGTAYWIDPLDDGTQEVLFLRRWPVGQATAESFPMGTDPGTPGFTPYLRAEFMPDELRPLKPGALTGGAPRVAGAEASIYWVRNVAGTDFEIYRYDVPAALADGTQIDAADVLVASTILDEVPTELAVASDGTLYSHLANSRFVGRIPALPGGGYGPYDLSWIEMDGRVQSVEVGPGDLLYVSIEDPDAGNGCGNPNAPIPCSKIVVLDPDGVPVEDGEITTYIPQGLQDFGQTRIEDVRDMVIDRSLGRIRLFDHIYTNGSPRDLAVLGVEIEPR